MLSAIFNIYVLVLLELFSFLFALIVYLIAIPFFKKHLLEREKEQWTRYVFGWGGSVRNPPLSPLVSTKRGIHHFDEEGRKKFPRIKMLHNIAFAFLTITFLYLVLCILIITKVV